MPSYEPPKKNTAYVTYVSLVDQTSGKLFKANPTLAAGDVKVSIDGGALANLATLPAVTPAASKLVKVDLSAGEMNGDNIIVIFSDAAGDEWNDLLLVLKTTARQIDDLMFPTVSGRSTDVTTTGEVGVDWANVGSPTTVVGLTNTTIKAVSDDVGITQAGADKVWGTAVRTLSAAGVQAIWDALTAALTTAGSIGKLLVDNINATISSRLATAGYTAPPTVGAIADQVWEEAIADHSGTGGSTAEALAAAGSAGDPWSTPIPGAYGAGTAGKILGDNINATISSRATQASVDTVDDFLDTEVAAIKAKTDNLPADPADASDIAALIDALPTATENADALLKRDWTAVSGEAARSLLNAARFLRNKWTLAAGTLTVTKEDDTTSAWTAAVTTDAAAEPVTSSDPT